MKWKYSILASLALILAFPMSAIAQEDAASADASADSGAIEEITVYGEKSVSALRHAVYRAEENFYAVFSALNEDDEYDIRCFYETPTGTRLRTHVCRARFVTDTYSADAARWRTDGPRTALRDPTAVIAQKSVKLQEKMEAMIAADPKLREALERYTAAQNQYKAKRTGRDDSGQ